MVLTTMLFLSLLQIGLFTQVSEAEEQPDLLMTGDSISFSRLDIVAGEPFTAYARIRNVGSGTGVAVARLYIRPEGWPLGANYSLEGEENVTVLPGGSSIASFPLSLSAGIHEVLVNLTEVSPDDIALSNNNASTAIEVFPSPDLIAFSSPTLILDPITIAIQDGTERTVPLNITALGGDTSGVTVVVLDSAGVFVEPAHAPIGLNEGEDGWVYIRISVPKLDGENGSVEKELLIQAVGDDATGNSAKVTLRVHPPVTSTSWWNPATTTATMIGLLAAGLAVINSIEWGRYKFLGIFLPLYTKLKKEDVMNQYTRGKIHGYLLANPGDYFSAIGKALGISGGNLAYHLRVLEREGEVVSRMDGVYKRFYPCGAKIESSVENELSSVQRSIYNAIDETPGIIQREIASLLGVTSATISYHLRKLVSRGMVRARRKGMAMRYFISAKNP
jgi:DNA-binding MarR family transcriptional regulator